MVINEAVNSNMTLLAYQSAAAKLAMTSSTSSTVVKTATVSSFSAMMTSAMMTSSMKMNTTSMMMMGTATSKMNSTVMMTMSPAPLATFHGAAGRPEAKLGVGGSVGLVVAALGLFM